MGWPLPDPVPLDPPPGDPAALADLATRMEAAAAFLGDLRGRLAGASAAACGWAGDDAVAADAQVARVGDLARSAAGALVRAAARVRRHEEVLTDVRQRLAQLRRAQAEDVAAAVARMGAAADPGTGLPGPGAAAAVANLAAAEAGRGRMHAAMLGEVEVDAAATAAVLGDCGASAGGGDVRALEDLLPGWHASALQQRGALFAEALLRPGADLQATEEAARRLLPWAGNGAVAAAVLTGLGADGVQEVLRRLGDGSLSAGSALAGVMAAVLGAPVPAGTAAEVARARDVRHVDPDDVRTLDADHVALGMGVVLAAARRADRPGPPPATVREWGRQVLAREQALDGPLRERLVPSPALPGDPLEEVLGRLARADAGPQAAEFLRAGPTWTTLLARSWDDGGAAFAAAVERATAEPGHGDVVVRSGLRALAAGLADDGDPAGWTVDRATATSVAPVLADAVAARPGVVTEPLGRAAAGAEEQDRPVLRGLGYLSADPDAAAVLDRALGETSGAPEVQAGYLAVRDYGQRLDHALGEFAAQEEAIRRFVTTTVVTEVVSHVPRWGGGVAGALTALSVVVDADGTWDGAADLGPRFAAPCGEPEATAAYDRVAAVLGAPTAPVSPPTDWLGLAAAVVPGGERLEDVVEAGVGAVEEVRELVDADTE